MNEKTYYAVFSKQKEGVAVEFPDFEGFRAFGFDFVQAYKVAQRKINGYLENEEIEELKEPTSFNELKRRYPESDQVILPVPLRR